MRLILAAMTLLMVAGCMGPAQRPVEPPTAVDWVAQGRIAVQTATMARAGSLRWEQRGEQLRVHVSGPVGRGTTEVVGDPDWVTIRQAGRAEPIAGPPQRVLDKYLGWSVPLDHGAAWLRGGAACGGPVGAVVRDAGERLVAFSQAGFDVAIEWGERHPSRVVASRGDLRVSIRIRRWEVGDSGPVPCPAQPRRDPDATTV